MELKQIESFVRVAELGSFTKAAQALNIPQPLLSRHVRQLEVELHQNLLMRNGRGVTVTEAGLVMLEHGRGILHQVAVAQEELGSVRGALAGRVSIGLPPSLSRLLTVPLTKAFRAALPQAQFTLTEGFSLIMLESLRSGRLDMALLYNPVAAPDLEISTLHEDPLVLVACAKQQQVLKNSISLAELSKLPLILPSRPNAFRILIDAEMARINSKPNIVLEIDGLNAILELVKEGLGYAVLPAYTLSNLNTPQDFSTHRIERPRLLIQLALVRSSRRAVTATHETTEKITRQVLAATLP
jgi:LysR family nitrogen assimilation transcriptional regulator